MKKIALIYWPKKGNVEKMGKKISEKFSKDQIDIYTITEVDVKILPNYNLLIIGNSTVGADNWEDAHKSRWYEFFKRLADIDLKSTSIAFYGLGDQILYPDHFVDGMAIVKQEFAKCCPLFIGKWPAKNYDFTDSDSLDGDNFIGLALDEDQQSELSEARIEKWIAQLKSEVGF